MATDPLQAALDEAQELMESLEVDVPATASFDDFAIDSDEEDDVPLADPLSGSVTGTETSKESSVSASSVPVHPLQDDFLQGLAPMQTQSSQSGPPSTVGSAPSINGSINGSIGASPPQYMTPTNGGMNYNGMMPAAPGSANAANNMQGVNPSASLDVIKQQTSRFASNFASFAQRAASQVVGTPTTPPTTGPSPYPVLPGSAGVSNGGLPVPTTTGTTTAPGGQVPMQAMVPVELDNEQKAALVQTHVGDLLPGERVIMFLSNLLHVSDSKGFSYSYQAQPSTMWCCAMTYYRIILFGTHPTTPAAKPENWNAACWPAPVTLPAILEMPLAAMDKVERSAFSGAGANPTTLMGLVCTGKHNGRQLRFTTPSYQDTVRAQEALQTYAFPGRRNLGYLFAFESKRGLVMESIVTDEATGKKTVMLEPVRRRFDGLTEFQRQFARGNGAAQPWAIWSTVNPGYQTCMSYPSILAGPASLDENNPEAQRTIRQCAAFRSEHRLPALTWCSGIDGASLWRCSQPKIGLQGNRSSADELFLKHILESASSANAMAQDKSPMTLSRSMLLQLTGGTDIQNWVPEPGCGLKILDLRPRSSAMANRTGGYGYENTSNYAGSTLQFCNIGNIHAVRDAYQKMSNLCTNPSTADLQWNALVEDTKWLSHIRLILAASWEAAFWTHVHRLPVVLHCSHGWDRTSQVAALAELLLDPFYRTREGFSCLVEKDFMSFGHPFHTRCAHGEGRGETGAQSSGAVSSDEGQISPIFLQFLDCVHQIVELYPEAFEFNTKYLLVFSEHVYSCRFGNLLCDTEREREMVAGIRQRTHSIWDFLDEHPETLNESFSAEATAGVLLMPLPTLLRSVSLWTERHCMYGPKPTDRWVLP